MEKTEMRMERKRREGSKQGDEIKVPSWTIWVSLVKWYEVPNSLTKCTFHPDYKIMNTLTVKFEKRDIILLVRHKIGSVMTVV